MRKTTLLFLALVVVIVVNVSCRKKDKDEPNCVQTVIGPSCVNGKVTRENPPPGPGEGVRASMQSWGVYEGDCLDNLAACVRKLTPTQDSTLWVDGRETYLLKNHQARHTLHLCVVHPEVAGRHISIRLQAMSASGGTQGSPFDEADPSKKSPLCMGISFNMVISGGVTNTGTGEVGFNEDNQDLFTPTEWKVLLGFRVVS